MLSYYRGMKVKQPHSICPSYTGCKSPLCPLDLSCVTAEWYPDEPICPSRAMRRQHKWIRKQIAIKKKGCSANYFFTMDMLGTIKAVHKSLQGVDLDSYTEKNPLNPDNNLVTAWKIKRDKKLRDILASGNNLNRIRTLLPGVSMPISQLAMFK